MVAFVGLIFFLIGLAVLVSGIISVFKVRRQIAETAATSGTVVNFGKINGQRGYFYCPQVAFPDSNGNRIEFQSEFGTQPPAYQIGQTVSVIYQKNNPQKAEIDSITTLWFAPGCMLVMAFAFTFLGLVLFGVGILVQLKT